MKSTRANFVPCYYKTEIMTVAWTVLKSGSISNLCRGRTKLTLNYKVGRVINYRYSLYNSPNTPSKQILFQLRALQIQALMKC